MYKCSVKCQQSSSITVQYDKLRSRHRRSTYFYELSNRDYPVDFYGNSDLWRHYLRTQLTNYLLTSEQLNIEFYRKLMIIGTGIWDKNEVIFSEIFLCNYWLMVSTTRLGFFFIAEVSIVPFQVFDTYIFSYQKSSL